MSRCYYGCVLGILVIVFAWVDVSWSNIALTVLGALLAVKALVGTCCCAAKKEQAINPYPLSRPFFPLFKV